MELTDIHLLQLSKRITEETTRTELGLNLGLPVHEIKMTRANNRDEFTIATYDMLGIWFRSKCNGHIALQQLEEALKKTNLQSLIGVLYDEFKNILAKQQRAFALQLGFSEILFLQVANFPNFPNWP